MPKKPPTRGADQNAPEMTNDGQQNFLEWLKSNPPSDEILEQLDALRGLLGAHVDGNAGFERDPKTGAHMGAILQGFELLPPEAQEQLRKIQAANEYLYNFAIETAIGKFTTHDSGQSFYNASPVLKHLMTRNGDSDSEIVLGANKETGEPAIFTLLGGYITPYEKEVIECVSKFKLDGQLTDAGKIWFTVGQLYRAMRHGAGTQSPTADQRAALMETLTELSRPERKLTFKLNDYLKVWGDFETNGGRVRLISFDELFGKIRGQEDILIILDDTPIVCAVAENLHMWEPIPQAVKAIKQERYIIEYRSADKVKKRSFATNEARQKFCKKNGLTGKDIIAHDVQATAWALSENRIALRTVLLSFVYSYLRARDAGAMHSNKLSYAQIFERCGVSDNREEQRRAKEYIAVIMNHFKKEIDGLKDWVEYTNKGSIKPDGVQISIEKQIEGA